MRLDGSIRSNLIAAIASVRRWRGRPVHEDTLEHWRRLLDHGRRADREAQDEVSDLVAELESQLAQTSVARR